MPNEEQAKDNPKKKKLTLAELLTTADFTRTSEIEAWMNDPPVGNELL